MNTNAEIIDDMGTWRPVVGWEETHMVSSAGEVRSLTRRVNTGNGGWRIFPERILASQIRLVYRAVHLRGGGRRASINVHTIVAAAFLGPRPQGHVVMHLNGDSFDNRLENLAYTTHRQNMQHSWDNPKRPRKPRTRNPRPCSIAICDNPSDSRGLCKPHYDKARRMGALPLDRRECRNGHLRAPKNTYTSPDGNSYCRPCQNDRAREWTSRLAESKIGEGM